MPATRGSVMVPSRGKRPTRGQQRQTESQAAQPKGGEAKTRGKNLKRKPNAKVEGEKKTKVKQEKEDGRTKSTVEEPKVDIGDVAPKVGSPTTAASPNNREKMVEQLAVCLRKAIVEMKAANNLPDGVDDSTATEKSASLVDALSSVYDFLTKEFKAQFRTIKHNLGAEKNPDLRSKFICGKIDTHFLCRAKPQELASSQQKEWRVQRKEQVMRSCTLDAETAAAFSTEAAVLAFKDNPVEIVGKSNVAEAQAGTFELPQKEEEEDIPSVDGDDVKDDFLDQLQAKYFSEKKEKADAWPKATPESKTAKGDNADATAVADPLSIADLKGSEDFLIDVVANPSTLSPPVKKSKSQELNLDITKDRNVIVWEGSIYSPDCETSKVCLSQAQYIAGELDMTGFIPQQFEIRGTCSIDAGGKFLRQLFAQPASKKRVSFGVISPAPDKDQAHSMSLIIEHYAKKGRIGVWYSQSRTREGKYTAEIFLIPGSELASEILEANEHPPINNAFVVAAISRLSEEQQRKQRTDSTERKSSKRSSSGGSLPSSPGAHSDSHVSQERERQLQRYGSYASRKEGGQSSPMASTTATSSGNVASDPRLHGGLQSPGTEQPLHTDNYARERKEWPYSSNYQQPSQQRRESDWYDRNRGIDDRDRRYDYGERKDNWNSSYYNSAGGSSTQQQGHQYYQQELRHSGYNNNYYSQRDVVSSDGYGSRSTVRGEPGHASAQHSYYYSGQQKGDYYSRGYSSYQHENDYGRNRQQSTSHTYDSRSQQPAYDTYDRYQKTNDSGYYYQNQQQGHTGGGGYGNYYRTANSERRQDSYKGRAGGNQSHKHKNRLKRN